MKRFNIFSAIGALTIGVLALMGCPTTHPDLEYPDTDISTMKGNWWYYELDTSAAVGDTINIIFSDGNGSQTTDITDVAKIGSVYYVWAAGNGKNDAEKSTRTDAPNKNPASDKLGVYVYTNAAKCNLWAWDNSNNNLTGEPWPGVLMSSDTAETLPTFKIQGIKLINYTDGIKGAGYIAFCEDWVPNNEWDATTQNKVYQAKSDGSYLLTFNSPADMDWSEGSPTIKIQILNLMQTSGATIAKLEAARYTATSQVQSSVKQ